MGIKKMFKKKEPTEAELVDDLNRIGISTKNKNSAGRPDQFSAFKTYAQEKRNQKPGFAPVNPYANINNNGQNPYQDGNPYQEDDGSSTGNGNPYGGASSSNPYSSQSNPSTSSSSSSSPYGQTPSNGHTQRQNPYASGTTRSYASSVRSEPPSYQSRISRQSTRQTDDTESLDLNQIPTNQPPVRPRRTKQRQYDEETLDLNDLPEEDDLNVELDIPEEEEVNSEDEEVEGIKQDIRFVKQESVASTRNTLNMAREADASGTNTLGMLGSQSSRLYNTEQNLLLAETQNNYADEQTKQLQRLQRSIFLPSSSVNPFNKKAKLRQKEAKIKTEKAQEKYLRENNRKGIYESEQRIKQGITNNATSSDIYDKYRGEKDLKAAQRYQFEADSEDDEMEKELAANLDEIGQYSKKLKNTAMLMGQEVNTQNERLRKIEDDADKLDINVHLNNTRLSNIR